MITALIGIQTVCIGVATYLSYKSSKRVAKMKMVKNEDGFKHYKAGGF